MLATKSLPCDKKVFFSYNTHNNFPIPYYKDKRNTIFNADCLRLLSLLPSDFADLIFVDPPYHLSNDGFTCRNGRASSVNKGEWDKSDGLASDIEFYSTWLDECKRLLKKNGSIWISGTYHSIYICGFLLQKKGFHILNDITWLKPNAAPNLSCRFFTASHETLIWARKDKKAKHVFNYSSMKTGVFPEDKLKKENTQMRSVWSIPTTPLSEKKYGAHPTQKPLALLKRILTACTNGDSVILDPFNGSGTTGVASSILGDRYYFGIEKDEAYCAITKKRLEEISTEG